MSISKSEAIAEARRTRQIKKSAIKATGSVYTPEGLANFLARQVLSRAVLPRLGKIKILDPAAGDGALLVALISQFSEKDQARLEVYGFDTDSEAVGKA